MVLDFWGGGSSGHQLVEHVVVPLVRRLECDAGLFQEVVLDNTALDLVGRVKTDLHELAKPTGVVITHRLSITYKYRSTHQFLTCIIIYK